MDDQARFQRKNKPATMEVGRTGTKPDPRRRWALALLCGAFFMVILDAAIVTVALPSIDQELDFSAHGLQWVVSAYALTFAGLLLLGGGAADLLGRRRQLLRRHLLRAARLWAWRWPRLRHGLNRRPRRCPRAQSGLASGLSNTSFQIGAAIGVAVLTTVAVSRTDDYLAVHTGASPLAALTEGLQSAFLAVAILAGIGGARALLLLGRPHDILQDNSSSSLPEPARAT